MSKFIPIIIALLAVTACGGGEDFDAERAARSRQTGAPLSDQIADLTERILQNPNNPNLYVSRALAYSEQSMFSLALKDVDRALTIDSTISFVHAMKGEVFFKMGELRNARLALERAVAYDPENTEALLKLGEVNFLLRRYPEAFTTIDRALAINDRLARGYFLKGYIFKELGDTTRSISSFQTASEVNPEYYEAFIELGHLQAYRGNPIALEYINTALELRPNSVEAWYHKGLYHQLRGQLGEAMDAYRTMVKRDPKGYLGYYNLGYIYLAEMEEFETALAYFDTVLTIQPAATDALYNKGLCFEEMGREQMAVSIYREVLSSDPQHTLAAMGLERLLE